jgi:hypothetical protein
MDFVECPGAIYTGIVAGDTGRSEFADQSVFNRGVARRDHRVTEYHDVGVGQALPRIAQAHLVEGDLKLPSAFVSSPPRGLRNIGLIPRIP